jgi:hypothetical protein
MLPSSCNGGPPSLSAGRCLIPGGIEVAVEGIEPERDSLEVGSGDGDLCPPRPLSSSPSSSHGESARWPNCDPSPQVLSPLPPFTSQAARKRSRLRAMILPLQLYCWRCRILHWRGIHCVQGNRANASLILSSLVGLNLTIPTDTNNLMIMHGCVGEGWPPNTEFVLLISICTTGVGAYTSCFWKQNDF